MDSTNATISTQNPSQGGMGDLNVSGDVLLMIMWVFSLFAFLCFPFCTSKRRRKLCLRRIRERRWINDDYEDDWYREAFRRRQARQQQLEDQQRQFRTTRTQEDEIREQFLTLLLGKFSTTLSKSDIHEAEQKLKRSASQESFTQKSILSQKNMNRVISPTSTEDTMDDIETPPAKPSNDSDSLSDVGSDDNMMILDFQETNEIVSIPLPGEALETSSAQRCVPNGCAICLSTFAPNEKVTWSSNPECAHIFHYDCIIHWFLTVGRKVQRKRVNQNPQMTESEALDLICDFPMLCPCCRQTFSVERNDDCKPSAKDEPPDTDNQQQIQELPHDDSDTDNQQQTQELPHDDSEASASV